MATTSTPVSFVETAIALRDAAQRGLNGKLASVALTPAALVDFAERYAASFIEYALVADLYNEALSREADTPGRGPAWLSMKVGQLLNTTSRSSSDKFYDAAAAAKREGAARVLRDMRPYLDATKVLEYTV